MFIERTAIVLILIVSLPCAVLAQIKGSTMGTLNTVVSDGPFDVTRNPALLFFSRQKSAIGAYGRYRWLDHHDYSVDAPIDLKQKDPETTVIGGSISAVFGTGRNIIGFSISDSGSELYQRTINRIEIQLGSAAQKEKSISESISPVLTGALCVPLTDHSSIGFQLFLGYFRENKKTTKNHYLLPAWTLDKELNIDREITRILGIQPALGFLFDSGDSQAGLLLRTGSFVFKNKQVHYDYTSYIPVQESDDERSYPFTFAYTGNLVISIGGYRRVNKILGFALEGAYTLQSSHTEDDLTVDEDFSTDTVTIIRKENTINRRAAVTVRGGIELTIDKRFSLTAGGAYFYNEGMSQAINYSERTLSFIDAFLTTLGLHYILTDSVSMTAALSGAYIEAEYNLKSSALSLELKDKFFIADVSLGVIVKI